MEAYLCAPQAPWQKGTVENIHGRLRRFLPLGADISSRSAADWRALAAQMNATPRKCPGYMTPVEASAASVRRCEPSQGLESRDSAVSNQSSSWSCHTSEGRRLAS